MKIETSARKVVTPSPQRKVGYVNCRWFQNESIEHESQLEKRFVQCALLCPKLVNIKSQPFNGALHDCLRACWVSDEYFG